jgi:hypothetical protein
VSSHLEASGYFLGCITTENSWTGIVYLTLVCPEFSSSWLGLPPGVLTSRPIPMWLRNTLDSRCRSFLTVQSVSKNSHPLSYWFSINNTISTGALTN